MSHFYLLNYIFSRVHRHCKKQSYVFDAFLSMHLYVYIYYQTCFNKNNMRVKR